MRRLAGRALAPFTRLDRLFALRAKYPARDPHRARLGLTPLEERVVPDGTQVTLAWGADGGEPGTAGAFRFTRTGDPAEIDQNPLAVTFRVGGTATAGADYTLPTASVPAPAAGQSVTVTFAPGQTLLDLPVQVADDAGAEGWETVTARLQPGGYAVGTADAVTVWVADDEVWLEADADPVVAGQEVSFWLPSDSVAFDTVEWDLHYDGTFEPDPAAGDDWYATATFPAAGPRTVAARVSAAGGAPRVVTLDITVEAPPPVLTLPDDMTVVVGTPVVLAAAATAEGGIAAVEWAFSYFSDDYDWYFDTDPSLTTLTPTHTFPWAGEWDVQVRVTGNNGETAEGWFHVTVENAPPAATVEVYAPIAEGEAAVFTVRLLDRDPLDTVTIYANWTGADGAPFDQVTDADPADDPFHYTVNPLDGSISFQRVYADAPDSGSYPAVIRVQDEWGVYADYTVSVVVSSTPPPFRPVPERWAGLPGAVPGLWAVAPGEALVFDLVGGQPNPVDYAEFTFHWALDGRPAEETASPEYRLPDYTAGLAHRLEAWVTDRDGTSTPRWTYTVVVNAPREPNRVDDQAGAGRPNETVSWAGTIGAEIYGGLYVDGEGVPPGYGPFHASTTLRREWPDSTGVTVRYVLDPLSRAFAAQLGCLVEYRFSVEVWDVEEFSFLPDTVERFRQDATVTLVRTPTEDGVLTVPWAPRASRSSTEDERMVVTCEVAFVRDGVVVRDFPGTAPSTRTVVLETHKSELIWDTLVDAYRAIRDLAPRLAAHGEVLVDAVIAEPRRVFNVLTGALRGAAEDFFRNLTGSSALQGHVYSWLLGRPGVDAGPFQGLNLSTATSDTLTAALLQYAGVTRDHVLDVARHQLGAGNLAALQQVAAWFDNVDPGDPLAVRQILGRVEGFDLGALTGRLRDVVTGQLDAALGRAGAALAAKFVPGAGLISSLARGLGWALDNAGQLADLFEEFFASLGELAGLDAQNEAEKTNLIKGRLLRTLNGSAVPLFLDFAASQLGLGGLPGQVRRAVEYVPAQVDAAIRAAVSAIAGGLTRAVSGGAGAGMFEGLLAPAREFEYQNKTYVLWAAQDRTGAAVKVAEKLGAGAHRFIGELTAQSFTIGVTPGLDGRTAQQHLTAFLGAAGDLSRLVKSRPAGGPGNPLGQLRDLQAAVNAAGGLVQADIRANACKALQAGCFAAGTKLLTRAGWRAVEDIRPGDEVLSRSEFDPAAPVEWKAVEETFRRTGCILHLHAGTEVIRTTPEHPFWVEGKGWVAAGALQAGDRLATLSGEWAAVEEAYDTGEWEPVYNLRVADHHTYFVGDDGWGFALWAHNAYMPNADQSRATVGNQFAARARGIYDQVLLPIAPSAAGTIAYSESLSTPGRSYVYLFVNPSTMTTAQQQQFRGAFFGDTVVVVIAGGPSYAHAEQQLYLQHANDIAAIGISNRSGPCGRPVGQNPLTSPGTGCWKFFRDAGWENVWWPN